MSDEVLVVDQEVQRLLSSEKVDYLPPNCEAYQWVSAERDKHMPQYVLVRLSEPEDNFQVFGVELPKEELFQLYEWISPKVFSEDELKMLSKGNEGIARLLNGSACLQRYLRLWDCAYGSAYAPEDGENSSKYVLAIWSNLAADWRSPRESHIKALEVLTGRKARWWMKKAVMSAFDFEPGDRY